MNRAFQTHWILLFLKNYPHLKKHIDKGWWDQGHIKEYLGSRDTDGWYIWHGFGASPLLLKCRLNTAQSMDVPKSNTYPQGQRSWCWQHSLPFGLGKVHSGILLIRKSSSVLHQMPAGTQTVRILPQPEVISGKDGSLSLLLARLVRLW